MMISSDAIEFWTSALVGAGIARTMARHHMSITDPTTRGAALTIWSVCMSLWTVATTMVFR